MAQRNGAGPAPVPMEALLLPTPPDTVSQYKPSHRSDRASSDNSSHASSGRSSFFLSRFGTRRKKTSAEIEKDEETPTPLATVNDSQSVSDSIRGERAQSSSTWYSAAEESRAAGVGVDSNMAPYESSSSYIPAPVQGMAPDKPQRRVPPALKKATSCVRQTFTPPAALDMVGDRTRGRCMAVAVLLVPILLSAHISVSPEILLHPNTGSSIPTSVQYTCAHMGADVSLAEALKVSSPSFALSNARSVYALLHNIASSGERENEEGHQASTSPCQYAQVFPVDTPLNSTRTGGTGAPAVFVSNEYGFPVAGAVVDLYFIDLLDNSLVTPSAGSSTSTDVSGLATFDDLIVLSSQVTTGRNYTMIAKVLSISSDVKVESIPLPCRFTSARIRADLCDSITVSDPPPVAAVGDTFSVDVSLIACQTAKQVDDWASAGVLGQTVVSASLKHTTDNNIRAALAFDGSQSFDNATTGVAHLKLAIDSGVAGSYVVEVFRDGYTVPVGTSTSFTLTNLVAAVTVVSHSTNKGPSGTTGKAKVRVVDSQGNGVVGQQVGLELVAIDSFLNPISSFSTVQGSTGSDGIMDFENIALHFGKTGNYHVIFSCQGVQSSAIDWYLTNRSEANFQSFNFLWGEGSFLGVCALMYAVFVPFMLPFLKVKLVGRVRLPAMIFFGISLVVMLYFALFALTEVSNHENIQKFTRDFFTVFQVFGLELFGEAENGRYLYSYRLLRSVMFLSTSLVMFQVFMILLFCVCNRRYPSFTRYRFRLYRRYVYFRIKRIKDLDGDTSEAGSRTKPEEVMGEESRDILEEHARANYRSLIKQQMLLCRQVVVLIFSKDYWKEQLSERSIVLGAGGFLFPLRIMVTMVISITLSTVLMMTFLSMTLHVAYWMDISRDAVFTSWMTITNRGEDPLMVKNAFSNSYEGALFLSGAIVDFLERYILSADGSRGTSLSDLVTGIGYAAAVITWIVICLVWVDMLRVFRRRALDLRCGLGSERRSAISRVTVTHYAGLQVAAMVVAYYLLFAAISASLAVIVLTCSNDPQRIHEALLWTAGNRFVWLLVASWVMMLVLRGVLETIFYSRSKSAFFKSRLSLFSWFDYASIFLGYFAGVAGSLVRTGAYFVSLLLRTWRADSPQPLARSLDPLHESFNAMLILQHETCNPHVVVFCDLLRSEARSNKDREDHMKYPTGHQLRKVPTTLPLLPVYQIGEGVGDIGNHGAVDEEGGDSESLGADSASEEGSILDDEEAATLFSEAPITRAPRKKLVRNKFWLALTLHNNPALVPLRRRQAIQGSIASVTNPVMAGYLFKFGKTHHLLRKRWFALKQDKLYYWNVKDNPNRPSGIIMLQNCEVDIFARAARRDAAPLSEGVLRRSGVRPEQCLVITTAFRSYVLAAESPKLRNTWVRHLRTATTFLSDVFDGPEQGRVQIGDSLPPRFGRRANLIAINPVVHSRRAID